MNKSEVTFTIAFLVIAAREICQGDFVLAFVFMGFAALVMIHGGVADPEDKE